MYAIPANKQHTAPGNPYINCPNNIVHGKAILAANNPPTAADPLVTGTFTIPEGVFIIWLTLVQSAPATFTPGFIYANVPMLVTPGETFNYAIDPGGAAQTYGGTIFGYGSPRQISSQSGNAMMLNAAGGGYPSNRYWGWADNAAVGFGGCIIVEW